MANEKQWVQYAEKHLKGRRIVGVRYLSEEEATAIGWYKRPLVIILDNNSLIYPSMDDEGNDGGALFGQLGNGEQLTFPVL